MPLRLFADKNGLFALPSLIVFVLFLFTACDNGGNRPEKTGPLVGLFLFNLKDPYINAVSEALRQRLAGVVELDVQDAANDQIRQRDQVDAFLLRHPGLLLVNAVDPKDAGFFVGRAKKAGIPIIFFNREPDLEVLRDYTKACFVGTNAADAGRMQGDLIADIWHRHPEYDRNHDGKCQYILFQGDPDNPEALARSEYSVRQAKERGVDMRQIGANLVCNWDQARAERAMAAVWAVSGQEIEMIISNNDAMAIGAIAVLNQHGFNLGRKGGPFIPVVGVDATEDAVKAIAEGRMSATVKQDSVAMAAAIAALAENALAGKDFLAGTPYACAQDGISVRIPYSPFGQKESQARARSAEQPAQRPAKQPAERP